jgi:hypothetical protein
VLAWPEGRVSFIDALLLGSQRYGAIVKRHRSSCFSSAAFATVAQASNTIVKKTVVVIRGTLCNNQSLFIVFFSSLSIVFFF